ncbi:MAG: DUF1501 domain-containing protein [Planctomycetales bacterium]
MAGVALADLLHRDGLLAGPEAAPRGARPMPHHPPRAKRVIQIFLFGGLSHLESFDYKPLLDKYHGQSMPAEMRVESFDAPSIGLVQRGHFPFRRRGESGQWMSDLFPHIAERADELTFIRSMVSSSGDHGPAAFEAHTGFEISGYPAAGCWVSYGLGSENDNLPAFIVFPDSRGLPATGGNNWSNGFLPARHQGILFHAEGAPVRDLRAPAPSPPETRAARLDLLRQLNQRHLESRRHDDLFASRIESYELAARMQRTIPEAVDLSRETEATHRLYGLDNDVSRTFGRTCLTARRLVERGVRFVQIWSGGNIGRRDTWDGHLHVRTNHLENAAIIDRPVAGLLRDLRQRGLLEDTLLIFNTEFGRMPFTQALPGKYSDGRDHNKNGFSVWLAGAGLKPGHSYGATDDFGYAAVDRPVTPHDFHATLLHLLGLDHTRLTYYHSGTEQRLTNVFGNVLHDLLA